MKLEEFQERYPDAKELLKRWVYLLYSRELWQHKALVNLQIIRLTIKLWQIIVFCNVPLDSGIS